MFLRQSTAQTVRFGPFLDITDGVTEEVALTLAQADMRLSKDGGAFAQKNAAGNATHDSDGWYSTSLNAIDTATVGELIMNVHQPANALPVWMRWWVVEEAVYDSIYGAAAAGPLQPTVAGRTLDVAATGEAGVDLDNTVGTLDAAQIGADAITAAKVAADVHAEAADAVWDEVLTGATHNIASSAGRRLRQLEAAFVVDSGTAQAGTATTITLAATASVSDDIYRGDRVVIIGGTGIAEHSIITAYNGTTKIATMAETWVVTPDATSDYEVIPATVDIETWQHQIVAVTGALPNVNVESVDAGAVDAAAIATDAIDADALATDAVNEIRDAILPPINTAFSNIPVFMVLASDHVTASTGLTLGVTRSIDGGAFGAGTGTAAEIANGMYQYDASSADMNGEMIIFRFTGASSDDTFVVVRTGG